MYRGKLTITNSKGEVIVFNHVIKYVVKASMIEVTCMKELEDKSKQRSTKHGVKGWTTYDYE